MHRGSNALLTAAIAAAFCACSSKEAAKTDSSKAASQAGTASAAASLYDPTAHVATIHAKEFSFDAPDSIQAGWTTFHLVNDGQTIHHAQLVRLDSGKTIADFGAAMKNPGPTPKWVTFVGGPNAPDPASSSDATVNLTAGTYAIVCLVDIPDKIPHMAKGMSRALTVTAAAGTPAAEPTSDASVILNNYSFTIPAALTAGKHTVKIENKGPEDHELELVRLDPGKTVKDLAKVLYDTTAKGPPPAHAIGGVAGMAPGTTAYATFDLTPGNYAMICFVPAPDGKPHLEKGMVKEFTIK